MKYIKGLVILSVLTCFLSYCTKSNIDPKSNDVPDSSKDTFFTADYDVNELTISNAFDSGRVKSTVQNLALDEISGIAESYSNHNALWSEEDSGNENKIYLLDIATGQQLANVRLSVGNRDWEDMSSAPGPDQNLHYIYLAEIGDNKRVNPTKYIYRFEEPSLAGLYPKDEDYKLNVDKIAFQYPDGIKNAEAVMIDPLTKDIYVISKEDQAVVYVARYPQSTSEVITLTKVGKLPIPTVTAADISPDGTEIIIKNYARIFYWKKTGSESVTQLLKRKPRLLPYVPEPKGESVCWNADASGYYTTSERGDRAPQILFYKRKN